MAALVYIICRNLIFVISNNDPFMNNIEIVPILYSIKDGTYDFIPTNEDFGNKHS